MTLVLAVAIVAAALAAVLAPLLGTPRPAPAPPALRPDAKGGDLVAELTRARDEKRSALEDLLALEADYKAGALAEADYAELKRQDETRALALIARVDALEAALGPDWVARLSASAEPAGAESSPAREEPGAAPGPGAPQVSWRRPAVLTAGAAILLLGGIGAGYVVATRSGAGPTIQAAGGGEPAMPGPVVEKVREYRARLEANPRDVEALVGLGQLNLQRNDVTQAIDYFKRALEVDAGHAEALTGLGMILAESGSFAEALSTFDRALARDPSQLEALWWKGQVQLYALKDYPGAIGTLERVVALLPPGPDQSRVTQALTEARAAAAAAAPPAPAARRPRQPARPAGSPPAR